MKKQLHSGTKWLFRFRGFFSGLLPLLVLLGISLSIVGDSGESVNFMPFFMVGILYLVLLIIVVEIYAQMTYNRWFYDFTGEQLRLERGIIWKKYSNVPYERIQNVDITRGVIARILGFSTVNIQTAGFSYSPNNMGHSEGYIPGVSIKEAENIREFLMKKISKKSRSGL